MAKKWTETELSRLFRAIEVYGNSWDMIHTFEFPDRPANSLDHAYRRYKSSQFPSAKINADEKPAEIVALIQQSGQTVPEFFHPHITLTKKTEVSREKYDRTAYERHIRELSTRKTLFETVGQAIIEASRDLPPVPVPSAPVLRSTDSLDAEDVVLIISDIQSGSTVSHTKTGGLGGFDTQRLVSQFDYLRDSLSSILRYHANPLSTFRIFFLGDLIDGSTIFFGQRGAIDQTAVSQVVFAVEHLTSLVNWISSQVPQVKCYGVIGNHGRIGHKGEADVMDNLDYLAYQWMTDRLRSNPRVTFEPSESWFQIVDVMGWRFLNVHGDDIKSWLGTPFYGADRASSRWTRLLKGITPRGLDLPRDWQPPDFDYICLGHHHTKAHFSNVLMNGCWPGGSEFSLKALNMGEHPTQKMFGVHPRQGITWMRDVRLREPEIPDIKVYR